MTEKSWSNMRAWNQCTFKIIQIIWVVIDCIFEQVNSKKCQTNGKERDAGRGKQRTKTKEIKKYAIKEMRCMGISISLQEQNSLPVFCVFFLYLERAGLWRSEMNKARPRSPVSRTCRQRGLNNTKLCAPLQTFLPHTTSRAKSWMPRWVISKYIVHLCVLLEERRSLKSNKKLLIVGASALQLEHKAETGGKRRDPVLCLMQGRVENLRMLVHACFFVIFYARIFHLTQ